MKSIALRTLALLPAPVIVAAIWWAGNRPVPEAPVTLQAGGTGQAEQEDAAQLPAKLEGGWKLQGKVERYDKKTLFDRINGAAPAYIRAGFLYSLGAEYRKQGLEESVVVDCYAMGSPARALGMYATERDSSYTFIDVGDGGYVAAGSLNFWRGQFYVKLAGYEEGDAMDRALRELAGGLAKALPDHPDASKDLAPLDGMPPGKLPNTSGYSHPALADVDGLAGVYYASYPGEGDDAPTFRLFLTAPEPPARARARLDKVKAYFERDGAKVTVTDEDGLRLITAATDATTTVVAARGGVVAGAIDVQPRDLVASARAKVVEALAIPGDEAQQ